MLGSVGVCGSPSLAPTRTPHSRGAVLSSGPAEAQPGSSCPVSLETLGRPRPPEVWPRASDTSHVFLFLPFPPSCFCDTCRPSAKPSRRCSLRGSWEPQKCQEPWLLPSDLGAVPAGPWTLPPPPQASGGGGRGVPSGGAVR